MMDMPVLPVLAIQISTVLLIAGVVCLVLVAVLWMKKRPAKAPGSSAEPSEVMDWAATAADILAGVGGKDNVTGADCCATRLRLEIRDYTAVNEKALKAAGASGVTLGKNTCQITFGPHPQAQAVSDELKKLL